MSSVTEKEQDGRAAHPLLQPQECANPQIGGGLQHSLSALRTAPGSPILEHTEHGQEEDTLARLPSHQGFPCFSVTALASEDEAWASDPSPPRKCFVWAAMLRGRRAARKVVSKDAQLLCTDMHTSNHLLYKNSFK